MEIFFKEIKELIFAILDYVFQPYIKERETEEELRHKKKKRLKRINKLKRIIKKLVIYRK
ncbi:hypothetical protein ISP05_13690 [Staphylococcus kloosii]|jgi:hypothetical protein|nr:hypothetical protein [Staphylococcus kloosii]